jgi:hypothetical protein
VSQPGTIPCRQHADFPGLQYGARRADFKRIRGPDEREQYDRPIAGTDLPGLAADTVRDATLTLSPIQNTGCLKNLLLVVS